MNCLEPLVFGVSSMLVLGGRQQHHHFRLLVLGGRQQRHHARYATHTPVCDVQFRRACTVLEPAWIIEATRACKWRYGLHSAPRMAAARYLACQADLCLAIRLL